MDTWAATAAGAYTLTENTLYTVEAFNDYLDHLTDDGILTITRWVFDGLRLVSLAQEACEARGWSAAVSSPSSSTERTSPRFCSRRRRSRPARLPSFGRPPPSSGSTFSTRQDVRGLARVQLDARTGRRYRGSATTARLIRAPDRHAFYGTYLQDIRPTTDDRPFFFHTTKLENQFQVAFGRSMLFGNGLSALLTLMAHLRRARRAVRLRAADRGGAPRRRPGRWLAWLAYFGALGAGFMLIEVAMLQRFVLLLGHPVYSLTVTLFSLLLGTGLGAALEPAAWRQRPAPHGRDCAGPRSPSSRCVAIVVDHAARDVGDAVSRPARIAVAVVTLVPLGVALGHADAGRDAAARRRAPQMMTWAWGMNGALSVVGATLAIFIAMNWGFHATLLAASATYLMGLCGFLIATQPVRPSQE